MRLLILSAIFSVFFQCTSNETSTSESTIEVEMIDFNKYDHREYSGSLPDELVASRKYILLENNTIESQLTYIGKLRLRQGKIYVMDLVNPNLLIFDMNGNLLHKFNRKGEGPGFYQRISDFDLDELGNLYILDGVVKQILVFDRELNYTFSKRLSVDAERIAFVDQDKFLLGLAPWNVLDWSGFRFALADKDFNVREAWHKYEDDIDPNVVFDFNFVKSGNQITFNRPIDNNVYVLSDVGRNLKVYNFDFGSQNMPDEVRRDLETHSNSLWKYRFLTNLVAIHHNYIMGTIGEGLMRERNFLLDRSRNLVFFEKSTVSPATTDMTIRQDLLFTLSDIDGDKLVSFLHPDSYERAQEYGLPQEVISHLMNEGYVICLEELK
ncbi:6-bladed beta-propeller [Peijinzhouia sedimentorum]